MSGGSGLKVTEAVPVRSDLDGDNGDSIVLVNKTGWAGLLRGDSFLYNLGMVYMPCDPMRSARLGG